MPEVWLHSIATLLGGGRGPRPAMAPIERELRPLAGADGRAAAGDDPRRRRAARADDREPRSATSPAFPPHASSSATPAWRPGSSSPGQSSRTGRISKAGPTTLRWAAVEAAQRPGGRTIPGTASTPRSKAPRQSEPRQGRGRPQGADRRLARARPQTALQAGRLGASTCPGKLLHSSGRLRPTNDLRSRGSCNSRRAQTKAPKETSAAAASTTRQGGKPGASTHLTP